MRLKMPIKKQTFQFLLKAALIFIIAILMVRLGDTLVQYSVVTVEKMKQADHERQLEILEFEYEQRMIQDFGRHEFRNATLDHFWGHFEDMIIDVSGEGEQLQRLRREH